MQWLDVVWIASAAASLTLAALHLVVWARNRRAWANLAFSTSAVAVAGIAWCELALMHAQTPAVFGSVLRWVHVPGFATVAGIVVFVRLYLGTGRRWLAPAVVGTRLLALVLNFVLASGLNYRRLVGVRQVEFLGQAVTVAEGVISPWIWLARASSLLLAVFIADAAVTCWRRGDRDARRRAWVVGGSLLVFIVAAAVHAALVQSGVMQSPYLISVFFLGAVAAMGSELTTDVVRTAELSRRLHENEARLRSVLDSALDAIVTVDERERIVLFNPAAEAMFRCRASEALGQPLSRFMPERLVDLGESDFERLVESASAGQPPTHVRRITGVRAEGEVFPLEASISRLRVNGRTLMTAIIRDTTERQRVEREAQQRREEVAHLSRVALVSELSGSLAHELNQPLGAILSNAQAIRRLLAREPADLGEIRSIVEDIVADDQHAAEVVHRVRLLLRRSEPRLEELDVSDVVRQGLRLVSRELADRHITLQANLETALPAVRGDRIQVQQVVLNLVMNSMDAMAQAGPPGLMQVRVERLGDAEVCVSVSDTGVGIDSSMLEEIFRPFVTTKPQGMGMGLAICRSIVAAHGGRLWAVNNTDAGATFRFALPTRAAAQR